MSASNAPFSELLSDIVDNRGRTCPVMDHGIPLIATNCLRNDRLYPTYDTVRYVSQETYKTWFRAHPQPGDILFVNKATPGRVCLVPDPVDFCIAQDMVAVRADPRKVYPRYLFAALRSPSVQTQIGQMHVGTLIPHFKKGDFDKLLIPLPSRKSQEIIGDIYYALSAKIDLNRRLNETLDVMALSLFKSLFVDFDPVRAKAEGRNPYLSKDIGDLFPSVFEDSEMGVIPAGWEVLEMGSCVDFIKGKKAPARTPLPGPGLAPVILIESFDADIYTYAKPEGMVEASRDDVLMVMDGASSGRVETGYCGIIGSTLAKIVSTEQRLPSWLLYQFLKSRETELRHHLTGTSIPHADKGWLRRQRMCVPKDSASLAVFARLLQSIHRRIQTSRAESVVLGAVRDALLPKLMSGEVLAKVRGGEGAAA